MLLFRMLTIRENNKFIFFKENIEELAYQQS